MAGGRPRKWDSKEALQRDIDRYYKYCDDKNRPVTIAGLAYYLDVDRQTIYNYEKKDEFFDTIKKAKNYIVMRLEEEAIMNGRAGTIFVMKQYGYTDKHEVTNEIQGESFVRALNTFTDKL